MKKTPIRAAQHMEGYLSPEVREKRIKGALSVIKFNEKHHGETFDAIAYRGASGAITASIIAHHLKKPLILVRKPEDTNGHSPYSLEGPTRVKRYLIVDDFMSSGRTYDAIREAVAKEHPHAECIGMLEVTYCESGGCDRRYRFSHEHQADMERHARIMRGQATAAGVEWITRTQPIPPTIKYYPVGIVKDGDKFKFAFEDNRQKLLVADTTPRRCFADIFNELTKIFFAPMQNVVPPGVLEGNRADVTEPVKAPVKVEPEVDGVDIYRTDNPFSNFFYNPMKYRFVTTTSDPLGVFENTYEQKTQAPPEAAVSAAAKG